MTSELPSCAQYDIDQEEALKLLHDLAGRLRSAGDMPPPQLPKRLGLENKGTLCVDEDTGEILRDLTKYAVWTVSTAKAGNGAEQLLDGSPGTYWQSDGPQPHSISAQFVAKRKLKEVMLYLKYEADESYTPALVSVRAGSNYHDLRVVRSAQEFENPDGWVRIPLCEESDDMDDKGSTLEEEEVPDFESSDNLSMGQLERLVQRTRLRSERGARRGHTRRNSGVNGVRDGTDSTRRASNAKGDGGYIRAHMIQIVIHCNHQNGRDSHVRMVKVLGPERQVAGVSSRFSSKEFQMHETIR